MRVAVHAAESKIGEVAILVTALFSRFSTANMWTHFILLSPHIVSRLLGLWTILFAVRHHR